MALEKTHPIGGIPISYWKVLAVLAFNPVAKQAVVGVAGYFDKATRDAGGEHNKIHEFLIRNTTKRVQKTRPATLEEKKEKMRPELVETMTDAQLKKHPFDIVESDEEVLVNSFDDFAALFTQGKWQEAAYNYLKSGAADINSFFDDAKSV